MINVVKTSSSPGRYGSGNLVRAWRVALSQTMILPKTRFLKVRYSAFFHSGDFRMGKNDGKPMGKYGGFMGISWGFHEDFMRISWGFHEDFMRISWGFHEDWSGIRWTFLSDSDGMGISWGWNQEPVLEAQRWLPQVLILLKFHKIHQIHP